MNAKEIYRNHRLKVQQSNPNNDKSDKKSRSEKVPPFVINAMEQYASQTAIAFMQWKEKEGYIFYPIGGYSKPNTRESLSEIELFEIFKKGI